MHLIGIDISKRKSTLAIVTTEGEVIEEPFEIEHTKSGFNLILEKIKDIPIISDTTLMNEFRAVGKELGPAYCSKWEEFCTTNSTIFSEEIKKLDDQFSRFLR